MDSPRAPAAPDPMLHDMVLRRPHRQYETLWKPLPLHQEYPFTFALIGAVLIVTALMALSYL